MRCGAALKMRRLYQLIESASAFIVIVSSLAMPPSDSATLNACRSNSCAHQALPDRNWIGP